MAVCVRDLYKGKAHARESTVGVNAIKVRPYQLSPNLYRMFLRESDEHPINLILAQLFLAVDEHTVDSYIS